MRSHLKDAEPRICPLCEIGFIPVRRIQRFCPPSCPCGGRCRYTSAAKFTVEGDLSERECADCGRKFMPRARDQKRCGADCPGKPDKVLVCASPRCVLPERDEDGRHLKAREFVVKGNSQGKGNQQYCSELCRDRESQWRLRQRFRRYNGTTPEQYTAMTEECLNLCAICQLEPADDPRPGHWGLVIDHDHATGELRGLLCKTCNKALGCFQDDPEMLRRAARYVEWFRAGGDRAGWIARP